MTTLVNGDGHVAATAPTNTADELNTSKRKRDEEVPTSDETTRVKRIQKDVLEVLARYAQARPYVIRLY